MKTTMSSGPQFRQLRSRVFEVLEAEEVFKPDKVKEAKARISSRSQDPMNEWYVMDPVTMISMKWITETITEME